MAYVTAANFRTATLAEYCVDLALTVTEVSDANLTATIARVEAELDDLTNDHFSTAAAVTYELSGDGSSMLVLPQRCTAVTTVKTRDYLGTLTTQAAAAYRLVSSLNAAGDDWIAPDAEDYVQVVPGQYLSLVSGFGYGWPTGPNMVQVVGTFGWTVTPPKVKRAVALMVYDSVKPMAPILRKAQEYRTVDAQYTMSEAGPTNIPEADRIIAEMTRREGVLLG